MTILSRILPRTMAGQMMAVLALSFAALLAVLTVLEQSDQGGVEDWAESEVTANRLKAMLPILPYVRREELDAFARSVSKCHDGYAISDRPYPGIRASAETRRIAAKLAAELGLAASDVRSGASDPDPDRLRLR